MSRINEKETYIKYHGMGLSDKKRIFLPFCIIVIIDIECVKICFFFVRVLNIQNKFNQVEKENRIQLKYEFEKK